MLKTQNFYVRSTIFVVLSLAGATITYLLYPILARIFSLQEFGDFVAIVGISNQALGILLAFSILSIGLVKQYGETEATNKTQVIQKVLLWLFLVLSALTVLVSPLLKDLLNIQHVSYFFILSLIMILAVPSNIWVGYLQGHKEQIRVGIFSLSTAILKIVLAVILAMYFGVSGGLWGVFIGSFFGLLVVYYLPGKSVPKLNTLFKSLSVSDKVFIRTNSAYILQAVFVVGSIVFLQNYDLLRTKILFSPDVAGIYGGVSVLSNALYYVTFLLIWILLPEFSIDNPLNNRRILRTAYRLIIALSFIVVVLIFAFGNTILPLLLGNDFSNQKNVLVVASLYQISLVSVALYSFYLLILRKRGSVMLASSVLLSCAFMPLPFTDSPYAVILSLWLSIILGVLVFIFFSKWQHRSLSKDASN